MDSSTQDQSNEKLIKIDNFKQCACLINVSFDAQSHNNRMGNVSARSVIIAVKTKLHNVI